MSRRDSRTRAAPQRSLAQQRSGPNCSCRFNFCREQLVGTSQEQKLWRLWTNTSIATLYKSSLNLSPTPLRRRAFHQDRSPPACRLDLKSNTAPRKLPPPRTMRLQRRKFLLHRRVLEKPRNAICSSSYSPGLTNPPRSKKTSNRS